MNGSDDGRRALRRRLEMEEWGGVEDPEVLRAAMARTRAEVRDAWSDVQEAVRGRVDLAARFENDPLLFAGAAFCVGLFLGMIAPPDR